MQGSQTQGSGDGKRSLYSIWCCKSVGIQSTWEKIESTRDPDATFPGRTLLLLQHQPEECTAQSSSCPGGLLCCAWVLKRGSAGSTHRGPWDTIFLWKLWAETQTVIELCSFGKGTILSHLECTAGGPAPPLVKSPGLSFHSLWPCPAEFRSVLQGDQSAMQSGHFRSKSSREAFVQKSGAVLRGYIAGANPISLASTDCTIPPGEGSFDLPLPAELSPMGESEGCSELGPLVHVSRRVFCPGRGHSWPPPMGLLASSTLSVSLPLSLSLFFFTILT